MITDQQSSFVQAPAFQTDVAPRRRQNTWATLDPEYGNWGRISQRDNIDRQTIWREKNLSHFGPCLTLNEQTDTFAQFWFWTDLALIFPAVRWSGIPVELFYQNQKFWRL